ncbi:HTH_48 domain-containing protein [Nephila pilipes]|uniref:HTH_48 domain-containing protein n=1 Tax=Nephila pilipes TaxID=299642 RepID=A0A8X6TWR6_NEPPI|nr:HTH_48 domain-containing protein [Nephila pilipes]
MSKFKQRANTNIMHRLRKSASETVSFTSNLRNYKQFQRKQAFYEWFSKFRGGYESLEDESHSGRPSTSSNERMVEQVKQLNRSDRRMAIDELVQEVGICHGSIYTILSDYLKD